MRGFLFFISMCVFGNVVSIHAAILHISDLRAVHPYIKDGGVVCLCIEETLIFAKESLGHLRWYEHQNLQLEKNVRKDIAREQALREWLGISMLATFELGTPDLPSVFSELAFSGASVLGVSLCPLPFIPRSLSILEGLSLDFTQFPTVFENGWISHPKTLGKPLETPVVEKNIFFTGILANQLTMEEAMLTLFSTAQPLPTQIVYVDHSLQRLESTEKACKQMQVPFVGLCYTPAQKRAEKFHFKVAELQRTRMLSLFSEEFYSALLESFTKKNTEEKGFEPPVPVRELLISNQTHSTTLPLFHREK